MDEEEFTKETFMRQISMLITAGALLLSNSAQADFFTLEADAQASYIQVDNLTLPGSTKKGSISGYGIGLRGRIQFAFINALVDYHHTFDKADMLHMGLGIGYRIDILPLIDVYIQTSVGLLMLSAEVDAFEEKVTQKMDPEPGAQARAGLGIEIPFAADFFAFGVALDVGGHYITGELGYDFTANVHLGLRI